MEVNFKIILYIYLLISNQLEESFYFNKPFMIFITKKVFFIIIISSALGLIFNQIRSDGIPLLKEEKSISWANDSLLSNGQIKKDTSSKNNIEQNLALKKDKVNYFENGKASENKMAEDEIKEPKHIKLEQAYKLYKQNILFIDAREKADYQLGHIKGALNLPFDSFNKYEHILKEIPKDKIIVTYCAGTDCDLSILLGNKLLSLGYKKTYIFFGGWNDWQQANFPVESTSANN